MYLNTHHSLLKPIHSLLTKPFDFYAQSSIQNLKNNMEYFYRDLEILAIIYDEEKDRLKLKLREICYKSELNYKCQLSLEKSNINYKNLLDLHSIQVQIERLYDLLKLRTEGDSILDLEDQEYMSVLNFLRFNELLALCIAGKAKVRIFNKKIIFSPADSSAKRELYVTWFARYIENLSNISTIQLLKSLNGEVNNIFLDFIFDKAFSIKFTEISKEGQELKCVRMLVTSIKLIFLIIHYLESNKTNYIGIDDLVNKFNLEKEDIVFLIRLQKKQLVSEQFLLEKSGSLSVHILTFIKSVRVFFNKLAEEFNESSKREYLLGGKVFEINSIKNRLLNSDYKKRYTIFGGINRGDIKTKNELDIEYIIYDKEEEWYYFIQSKYSVFGERSYFEGELKQIQSDIGKGLKQLRSAKELFEKGELFSYLNKIGIEKATVDNCSFILLHNIPQLDFQITIDKIALYDWSTFRNLLKNGECTNNGEVYNLDNNIILNEPQKVIDILLSKHKIYSQIKVNIDINHKIVNKFTLGDKKIIVAGLGL